LKPNLVAVTGDASSINFHYESSVTLTAYNEFEFSEAPDPEVADNEVLIAVKACGIYGSDIHGMDVSSGRRQPPIKTMAIEPGFTYRYRVFLTIGTIPQFKNRFHEIAAPIAQVPFWP